jgi:hypothetical protein
VIGPDRMLETWGLRISGASLKSPFKVSTGGEPAIDDDLAAVRYVERLKGFVDARPVLAHVHIYGRSLSEFPLRQPGESLPAAIERLGWWMLIDTPPEQMAGAIYRGFFWILESALRRNPFIPPSQLARYVIDEADPTSAKTA